MKDYVNHPRYGIFPIPSGYKYRIDEIQFAHWRYGSLKIYPETAIPANIDKQNYAIYPRSIYVDIEEKCVDCKRYYIFFALEQKYWFEELNFWVDSHSIKCNECRKKDHVIKKMQNQYCYLVTKNARTPEDTMLLKSIAQELFELGYIKNINKVNQIS